MFCTAGLGVAEEPVRPLVWPEPLRPGGTIMMVAPAGELDPVRVGLAKKRLEERGYRVVMRDDLFTQTGYLAGSDERRAEEFMQAFLDPEVDAVFPGTGGYGTMRMLDLLDYDAIRANPKVLIGFSDITALHLAINRRAGLVTYHSPNPMWGLGSPDNLPKFAAEYFFRAVEAADGSGYLIEVPEGSPQPFSLGSGQARGRLIGGNLSLVAATIGTPFEIDTTDAVLMLEDVREAPYRIDRMLRQMQLAGKLGSLRAAVLGQFTKAYDREDEEEKTKKRDERFTVNGVLKQYFEPLGIPVLMNYPVGHHPANATMPMGGMAEVDADAATLRILPRE
ncbi:MAG: LD-carboxypeptidase [Planctomycetota bacterium]